MGGPGPRRTLFLLSLPVVAVLVVGALAWREAGVASEAELVRRGESLIAVVGKERVAAVEAVFGRPLAAVESDWKAWVASRK